MAVSRIFRRHKLAEEWSISGAICETTGISRLSEALVAAGVCSADCVGSTTLTTVQDWFRAGAETYGMVVSVRHDGSSGHYVYAKACVALGDLGGVERVCAEWLARRTLLASHGVETPKLYALHKATFIEEHLPISLVDSLKAYATVRQDTLRSLGATVGVIIKLGFPAFSLGDLRVRDDKVIVVDFGEDLGPSGLVDPNNMSALESLLNLLEQAGAQLSSLELQTISEAFERAYASGISE